jgi:glucose-6-phosphate isomerase
MSEQTTGATGMAIAAGDAATRLAVATAIERATRERWAARLAERDTSLWTTVPAVAEEIGDRLGWLDAPARFTTQIPALEEFGERIRDAGFRAVVVAGMGGSSLAPDVLGRVFGTTDDWLELRVLDSTDPAAVAATVDDLDPLSTLVIVSSKSGTTTETAAFQADAWARTRGALEARGSDESPGMLMAAITDPGRSLSAIAHHDDLREVFLNPPDIGGRYSALTYVGLIPASLIGIDLDPLLESAGSMLERCRIDDAGANPGLALGVVLGTLARLGRDKLTLVADPALAPFGAWLEQLVAESTGKHGSGIVPVDLEPLGGSAVYGSDRVFVRLAMAGAEPPAPAPDGTSADDLMAALEADGHPVIRIGLEDPMDLGGEFVRWEVATAMAGAVLGIDPFDQPDVESAKEATRRLLENHGRGADLPEPLATTADGLSLYAGPGLASVGGDAARILAAHLARLPASGYLAVQAFVAPGPARDAAIEQVRRAVRDRTGRATTAGYGPRFLHSTGQLHKGGPRTGCFLQLTADHRVDREIPGWPYTFGQLIDAQAAGDRSVLLERHLPTLRIHLGHDTDAGFGALERLVTAALDRLERGA